MISVGSHASGALGGPLSSASLVRYGFAVFAVAAATVLQLGFQSVGLSHVVYILFYPAVAVAATLAGTRPGILATLLSAVAGRFLFLEPRNSFQIRNAEDIVGPILFLIIGLALTYLAASRRGTARALMGGKSHLKRAHERLQEYERVIEDLEDLIVVVDRNYRYVMVNRAFLRYWGMKKDEVIGRKVEEILGSEVFEVTVGEKINECFKGKIVQYEMQHKYPSIGVRALLISYLPIEGVEGVERVACVLQDVTEKKRADQALRLFRALIDQVKDAVEVLDPQSWRFLDINEQACKDLGYTRDEMLALTVSDINPGFDESNLLMLIGKLHDSGSVVHQGVHRRKNGSTFPVETSLRCVHLDREYIVAVSRDISERKEAEGALRAREEHFRILVEQASDGIFISDAQGKYVDVNSAGAEMLGYTREEILRLSISDIVAVEQVERVTPELSRLLGGATFRSEWKFRRKDGSYFPGEVVGKRLPDGRLQGILRDVTERWRAEELLRHSEERFRVALQDSPITVFSQDRELRYTWIFNPCLYWQQDILGKTDDEVLGRDRARRLRAMKSRVLETGAGIREEVVIPHQGKSHSFDITVEPLFDSERKVVGITGASMDIARLRELADSLQDAKEKLAREKSYLEGEIQAELGFEQIIGQSESLRQVLKKARVVAPTDSTVLLLGETGTGKEMVARSLHALSTRRDRNFIKLNCAAVPTGLLESELFGHEKGAFTGAVNQKIGRLELADKGTLFLDEVGELPPELQPKFLRVLQDREFERLGGVRTLHVDVRIISATNRDLKKDVIEKRFREDLFYRLDVFPIELPPLRERRSDIPILVHYFVHKHATRAGKHINEIPTETMEILQNWGWPGNIRELENVIERMVILSKGRTLASPPIELNELGNFAQDKLTDMEREHIIRVLRETHGVLSGADGAATRLGMKRTTLQSMLKRFNIAVQDYRANRRLGS